MGSQILSLLGFRTQETYLGYYKGEEVVVIKDFNQKGYFFVPFNDIGDSSLEEDREQYQYTYEDITKMLEENKKITNIEETISVFWEMYIVDALPSSIFQGIPGLNLEKRKKVYYRVNRVPVFISERSVSKNRENLYEKLEKVCMDYYNQLEWLIRTDSEYSGDNLIVERYRVPVNIKKIDFDNLAYGDVIENDFFSKGIYDRTKQLLKVVGSGVDISTRSMVIDESCRIGAIKILLNQYETACKERYEKQRAGIEKAKERNVYKGRKKIVIEDFVIDEVINKMKLNLIDEKEAMKLMNVSSKSTFYRRIKEYKEKTKDI